MEYGKKTENHGKWETFTWYLKNDDITKKPEKWELHSLGPGIWRKNWKSRKMRNTHFRTRNMARKTEKRGNFRNVHCRTWNIAKKTEKGGILRNVHCRAWNMARKLKNMDNEKHPLDALKNDKITEKREKWEMHTVRPGIWRENWKSWKMKNFQLTTWKMTKSLKNVKNEKCTL